MHTITVCNMAQGFPDGGEYIGRTNFTASLPGSSLANIFPLSKYSRAESLRLYRQWLWYRIKNKDEAVLSELHRLLGIAQLRTLNLVCFCAPKPCHGDIISACLTWLAASAN